MPGSMLTVPICIATDWMDAPNQNFRRIAVCCVPELSRSGFAGGAERDWSAYDRHVPAVASGYCAPTQWLDRASAIHDFRLSHRICSRANFLWPCVRSSRPQAGPDRGDCALLCREPGLRVIDIDRD